MPRCMPNRPVNDNSCHSCAIQPRFAFAGEPPGVTVSVQVLLGPPGVLAVKVTTIVVRTLPVVIGNLADACPAGTTSGLAVFATAGRSLVTVTLTPAEPATPVRKIPNWLFC